MEDSLFDLLIPFLTFAFIVGGSLLKSASDKNKDNQNQGPKHRPVRSTDPNARPEKRESTFDRYEIDESDLDEQKDKQLDQLKKELSISTKSNVANQKSDQGLEKLLKSKSKRRSINKKDMKFQSYFTDKGLAGSVVMAEVLGKPRAKKPYRPFDR